MGGFDNATWQALGLVLTLLGLGTSAFIWMRKGPADGLRAGAWSLIPLAAGLTGTLRLGWDLLDSIVSWAGRFVFSPTVWLGVIVALLSGTLFVVSGFMRRRTAPTEAQAAPQSAPKAAATGKAPKPLPQKGSAAPTDNEFDDIEAILRKHGIS